MSMKQSPSRYRQTIDRKFLWSGSFLVVVLLFMTSSALYGKDYSFKVRHHHLKGSCKGDLIINESGIRYQTSLTKDQRQWSFDDIQEIQFISDRDLNLVTYEDSRQRLGGDRIFKFELQDNTIPKDLVAFLNLKFPKPISYRLKVQDQGARYEFPVKHLHRIGGCQGKLVIAEDGISYLSSKTGESRHWRYSDLQSIGSSGLYELRLGTYEHGPLQYGDTKEFRFQLKTKLDDAAYRFAWSYINDLTSWKNPSSGPLGR